MTEDEAKGKWCPLAGKVGQGVQRLGRPRGKPAKFVLDDRCIGSACMAWRILYDGTLLYNWIREDGSKEVHDWVPALVRLNEMGFVATEEFQKPSHGYCGAFGKP